MHYAHEKSFQFSGIIAGFGHDYHYFHDGLKVLEYLSKKHFAFLVDLYNE